MPHITLEHTRHTVRDDDATSPFSLSLRSSTGKPRDATITLQFQKGGHEQEMRLDYGDLLALVKFLPEALAEMGD